MFTTVNFFLKKTQLFSCFNYVYICMLGYVHVGVGACKYQQNQFPGARDIGNGELPDMGAGNQDGFLQKSSILS